MAGLTITVGGNDITAYVDVRSIVIEEVGTEIVAVCRFAVRDHSGTVSISTKDTVDIDDDGTTIFAGEVATCSDNQEGITKTWSVTCHDYNILLDETVIESAEYVDSESDSYILNDLFTTYRSDIDAATYVSTLDATMEDVAWAGMTLREILDDLASRTGARYYVDYDKNLHWFDTEADTAAFSLSTSPDMSASYPFGGFRRARRASKIAEKVYVLGKEVSGWYPAGAPSYDGSERHAVSRDQRITTSQGVEDRGKAIYDRFNAAQATYELWTEQDGLHAGESITVVNATWGINSAFYIRKMQVEFLGTDGETRRYHLWLNDEGPEPARSARHRELVIARLETEVNSVGDTVFDTDAPSAPTALDASNVTTGVSEDADGGQIVYAEITWSEVSDSDLDYYQVQLSTQGDFSSDVVTRQHPAGGGRLERFTGLVGNTTYYVRVRAVDWVGNTSAWDYGGGSAYSFTSSKDAVAPAQVSGLSASSSRTIVGLSWTANSEGDLRQYEIQRAPDSGGAPGAWATIAYAQLSYFIDDDFTDAQIAAADTFWYRVRAVDTSGNDGAWATQTSVALGQITTDHIAANTITASNIAANTITATEMNVSQLSAITADLGTITAGMVTGATIRTAASGARVVLDSTDGVQVYNSSGTLTAQLDVDGSGQLGSSDYEPIVWNAAGEINKLKANQINLGDPGIFSESDGLLLLGPGCEIASASWTSLRGQEATISGAFHQVAGAWPETRALVIEDSVTNYTDDPILGKGDLSEWSTAGGTSVRSSTHAKFGSHSIKFAGIAGTAYLYDATHWRDESSPALAGSDATLSMYLYMPSGTDNTAVVLRYYEDTGSGYSLIDSQAAPAIFDRWVRVTLNTSVDASATKAFFRVDNRAAQDIWVDGGQLEAHDSETTLCYGDLAWCSWSGTEDASTSTRTATTLNIDSYVDLVNSNDQWSMHIVWQPGYDYDKAPSLAFLAQVSDGSNDNQVGVFYRAGTDKIEVDFNSGAGTVIDLTSSALTFSRGDWLSIDITIDYTGNANLYIDGVLEDTLDISGFSAPSAYTVFEIGSSDTNTFPSNGSYAELALFDSVLTVEEIAGLYQRQDPLIDVGTQSAAGIYILDGRFRVASAVSGNRIEIDADEIAAYNTSGTKTFYVQASDGKALAGAGSVWLDDEGLTLSEGNGVVNTIKWAYGSDTILEMYANETSGSTTANMQAETPSTVGSGDYASLAIEGKNGSDITQVLVVSPGTSIAYDDDGEVGFYIKGNLRFNVLNDYLDARKPLRLTVLGAHPGTPAAGFAYLYMKETISGSDTIHALTLKDENGSTHTVESYTI